MMSLASTRDNRIMLVVDASLDTVPSWFGMPWHIPTERVIRRRMWTFDDRESLFERARTALPDRGLEAAERSILLALFEYQMETTSIYAEVVEFLLSLNAPMASPSLQQACRERIGRLQSPQLAFEVRAGLLPDVWAHVEQAFDTPTDPLPYQKRRARNRRAR